MRGRPAGSSRLTERMFAVISDSRSFGSRRTETMAPGVEPRRERQTDRCEPGGWLIERRPQPPDEAFVLDRAGSDPIAQQDPDRATALPRRIDGQDRKGTARQEQRRRRPLRVDALHTAGADRPDRELEPRPGRIGPGQVGVDEARLDQFVAGAIVTDAGRAERE